MKNLLKTLFIAALAMTQLVVFSVILLTPVLIGYKITSWLLG